MSKTIRNAYVVAARQRQNAGPMIHKNQSRRLEKEVEINQQLEEMEEDMDETTITCMDCEEKLPLKVCMSAAGYYLGYWCNNCGPYDRVSGYFRTREDAEKALKVY